MTRSRTYRRVLAVDDGSGLSDLALHDAIQLAQRHGARLHLTAVVRRPSSFVALSGVSIEAIGEELYAYAERELRRRVACVPRDLPCSWQLISGEPARVITRLLEEHREDLMVLGSARARNVLRWRARSGDADLARRCVRRSGARWRVSVGASGAPVLEPAT